MTTLMLAFHLLDITGCQDRVGGKYRVQHERLFVCVLGVGGLYSVTQSLCQPHQDAWRRGGTGERWVGTHGWKEGKKKNLSAH